MSRSGERKRKRDKEREKKNQMIADRVCRGER